MARDEYLITVRTEGYQEGEGVPQDAVIGGTYWHPTDREWVQHPASSLDALIAELEENNQAKLVQRLDLERPYEHELIFSSKYWLPLARSLIAI